MKAIIIISRFILASRLAALEICTVNSLLNICTRMLFKTIMKEKKVLQGPAGLDVQAAVFRVGRHATLLFNNVIRMKEAI